MTVLSELSKIAYIGNSSQVLYPIPFEYINVDNIYVSVYTDKNEFVENWTYSNQYIIDNSNVKVLSGFEIDNTKKLLIIRVIDAVQDNRYREGGDFPAKSTETSFDKLTMLIQQHQEVLDRCVKVEVLDNQTPEELLEDVYNKFDAATEIAAKAIVILEQSQTATDNAKAAVESAERTLIETQAYVTQAKSDIEDTKNTAISTIDNTVLNAKGNISNTIVSAKADINAAIDEATMNISDTVNTGISSITEVKDSSINTINTAVSDAKNISEQVIIDINNAKTTAESNIDYKVLSANNTIDSKVNSAKSDIIYSVNAAKDNISNAVSTAESNISTIVSDAEGSITNIAVTEANKAIANAAQEATDTATANVNSYVNTTILPPLQNYVNSAQSDANNAAISMEQAALSAKAASDYASNASADADNAAESAALASADAGSAARSAEIAQQIKDSLGNVYVYKGSVNSYYNLPSGASVGDVYNVVSNGKNYAWTGSEWDDLGGTVDLSEYQKTADADSKYATKAQLNKKADDANVVHKSGDETINDRKTFTGTTTLAPFYVLKENSDVEGGQIYFNSADKEINAGKAMWIDRYNGQFRFVGTDSSYNTRIPLTVDIQNNACYGITPPTTDNSTKIATTAFFRNNMQVVSALPSSPTAGVFYFVKE